MQISGFGYMVCASQARRWAERTQTWRWDRRTGKQWDDKSLRTLAYLYPRSLAIFCPGHGVSPGSKDLVRTRISLTSGKGEERIEGVRHYTTRGKPAKSATAQRAQTRGPPGSAIFRVSYGSNVENVCRDRRIYSQGSSSGRLPFGALGDGQEPCAR